MAAFEKLAGIFKRPKQKEPAHRDPGASSPRKHPEHGKPDEDSDRNACGALSEIGAPEPCECPAEESPKITRRASLDQRLSHCTEPGEHHQGDLYRALSEVATPSPIRRQTEDELACHPSLDEHFRSMSHH
ncbi:hypothetical protein P175DRAFT_0504049 [Aspergillus ochraceoroseus IBT 24754]|uniref:Uncharacterized protein n=1 Tax=Aspergillus ochraceoroseus IBT 24754 TaxID=1392256 RepID=A0A2T5LPE0_9EURO|nr:uncharacterized protein P175DRAFT_0504049 [Aspergillus ochraceoroseus IBT 24754]PTU18150.1 hypothetical protein P175DRAFT_0504049 [Aspergillus ochraceoroseus IBT 24754]